VTVATPAALSRYAGAVQAELRAVLQGLEGPLYTMVRYHLGWVDQHGRARRSDGGKGLRSTLCLLADEAAGGDVRLGLPAAAALELVHSFSLVHDDIQDRSPLRHHRPTVWTVWGEAQAINAGAALFALARLALLRLVDAGVPLERVTCLARALDEACLRLCEGQQADLALETAMEVSVEDYLAMIQGKTAALMAAACWMGASLGELEPSSVDHLSEAGRSLGLAFQVRDDVLGIWGTAAELGKPVTEDVWERKKSLPVVCALQCATGPDREQLQRVYGGDARLTEAEVDRVVALLEALGARSYCQETAERYARAAVEAIDAARCDNHASDQLKELARFAAERDY